MTQTSPAPLIASDGSPIASSIGLPIVLVGLMGVGKSTVGRRLADALGVRFVDVDEEIERAADRSIAEIFATHGEAYFRAGERRVIARLMGEGQGVVATGGGAFADPSTRALIRERAVAVWLDCDIDTLVQRTSRRDTRPLLQGGDPRVILTELMDKRREAYAQAHIRVETGGVPHQQTVRRIQDAIAAWQ